MYSSTGKADVAESLGPEQASRKELDLEVVSSRRDTAVFLLEPAHFWGGRFCRSPAPPLKCSESEHANQRRLLRGIKPAAGTENRMMRSPP